MWLIPLHLAGEEEPWSTTRLRPFLPQQLGSSQASGICFPVAPSQLGVGGGAGAAPHSHRLAQHPTVWLPAVPRAISTPGAGSCLSCVLPVGVLGCTVVGGHSLPCIPPVG